LTARQARAYIRLLLPPQRLPEVRDRRRPSGGLLIRYARLTTARPRLTISVALVLGVAVSVVGVTTPARLGYRNSDFLSQGTESFNAEKALVAATRGNVFPELVITYPASSASSRRLAQSAFSEFAERISPPLFSGNRHTVALLGSFDPGLQAGPTAARLASRLQSHFAILVGGTALVGQQFKDQVRHDLLRAELLAFPLIFLLALMIFRSIIAAVLPVAVALLAVMASFAALRVINDVHPVTVLALNLVTGVAVALAVDYSLLMVSRYREHLAMGYGSRQAATATVATAGRAIAFSSAAVATAFSSLLVFPMGFIRSVAVGGAVVSIASGVVALGFLPAVLSVLGNKLNAFTPAGWRRRTRRIAVGGEGDTWRRIARFVTRRSRVVTVVALVVLGAFASPVAGMRITGQASYSLATSVGSQRFDEQVEREFTPSLLNELAVVARGSTQHIDYLEHRYLDALPNVAAIHARQLPGALWDIQVKSAQPPFASATEKLVHAIRALPANLAVTGVTADYIDTARSLRSHLLLAAVLLTLTTLMFFFATTRSVVLPVKALLMNCVVLAADFGVLVWIFQQGRLQRLLGYHSESALPLMMPVLLGAGLFGILTDYGIFLLARIRECWDTGMSNEAAIVEGLARTGRIITSAALLFCVAIGALVTSRVIFLKEAGIGIAAGVAIDAAIVRMLLVPGLMMLLGRWNWWLPGRSRVPASARQA
jgi:uncharacterized membrane protein YdfJ with MMPL/SSD domain